jgi:hypothetical protein
VRIYHSLLNGVKFSEYRAIFYYKFVEVAIFYSASVSAHLLPNRPLKLTWSIFACRAEPQMPIIAMYQASALLLDIDSLEKPGLQFSY